jgi:hypothetical protein
MNENTTTPTENEELTPEPLHEEENFSSGNRKLGAMVGAIVLVVGLGYALLPAKATQQIINVMPTMELGGATVTGSRAAEEAPKTEEETADAETPKTAAELKAVAATKPAAPRETAKRAMTEEAAAVAAPAEVEVEPVPAAEPAAPATLTISGRILNENGRPMAGATVLLKGSKKAVGTDANGNYTLEVPAGDNTLVYGYGGYQDQEMRAHGSQPLNVTLLPDENAGRRRKR